MLVKEKNTKFWDDSNMTENRFLELPRADAQQLKIFYSSNLLITVFDLEHFTKGASTTFHKPFQ